MENDPKEILSSALSFWWLRPENGLAIASYIYNGFDFTPGAGQQSADYACGDGVNTFFKVGGRFDFDFDIFGKSVNPATAHEIVQNKVDVFDYDDPDYAPKIRKVPEARFTYGTDHKPKLLAKAAKLGFYDQLIEANLAHDAPIEDGSLDLVYCNSLYWTEQSPKAVELMYRKLKSGGLAVFDVMTSHRKKLRYQHLLPTLPEGWQKLMNRGRDENNPGIQSAREWRRIFAANGAAVIEDERDIFPAPIAYAWNIGLRPIFPVLNRMVQSLTPENRHTIKEEWVAIWTDLLLPLLTETSEFPTDGSRVRLQFVIRKR